MKTSIKTFSTICAVVISLTASAQHRSRGNETPNNNHASNSNQQVLASNNDERRGHHHGNNGHHYGNHHYNHPKHNSNHWNGWNSGININFGWNYGYGNYYGNNFSMKRAARNSIRQSANIIGDALNFSDWNDTYSPWLAKAIRHQKYAKQLYFWGDYAGALNHAERAGYLAWNTLSYFNNGYGYNDDFVNDYPNPYSDPNNPYYRKNNSETATPNNANSDDDFGYRKANNGTSSNKVESNKLSADDIDTKLPDAKINDKELLKTSAKDLDLSE